MQHINTEISADITIGLIDGEGYVAVEYHNGEMVEGTLDYDWDIDMETGRIGSYGVVRFNTGNPTLDAQLDAAYAGELLEEL